ncbi:hypothetical protein HMI54_010190 [Coelomomyces lativittatus]|nr:hypothetical protein HMI54_010190 [Coelomomyces lativittatus]
MQDFKVKKKVQFRIKKEKKLPFGSGPTMISSNLTQRITLLIIKINDSAPHLLQNEDDLIATLQKLDPFLRRTKRKFLTESLTMALSHQKALLKKSNTDSSTSLELSDVNEIQLQSDENDLKSKQNVQDHKKTHLLDDQSDDLVDDQALYANKSNQLNRSMLNLYRRHKPNTTASPSTESSSIPMTSTSPPSNLLSTPENSVQSHPTPSLKREATKESTKKNSPESKRRKKNLDDSNRPNIRLSDLGGIENSIEMLLELVAMPLLHPEIYLHTGVSPPM